MKIQSFISVSFLMAALSANAQEFAPTGAIWHYTNYEGSTWGFLKVECVGDTIIDGLTCKQLKKTKGLSDGTFTYENDEFIYNDGAKAYLYIPNDGFYTLYNFDAQIGDTWTTKAYDMYEGVYKETLHQVDSIGSLDVNGVQLKVLFLETLNGNLTFGANSNNTYSVVIEKLGGELYMLPQDLGLWDIDVRTALRCYADPIFGEYNAGIVENCEYIISGNSDLTIFNDLSLYPNPTADDIHLIIPQGHLYNLFRLYDMQGKVLEQYYVSGSETEITFMLPASGAYFIHAVGDRYYHIKKIIKL